MEDLFNKKGHLMKTFLISMLMVFAVSCARAELYLVPDVAVSADLASVTISREAAFANGQVEAFWRLMNKLAATEDIQRLPMFSQNDIAGLVQDVSVQEEKTTDTKYMGSVSVRFKPKAVQDLLTSYQIPFLMKEPPHYLVIPILLQNGETLVFEEDNPLRPVLAQTFKETKLYDTSFPIGDINELTAVQTYLTTGDATALYPLLKTYGAARLLLVTVAQRGALVQVQSLVLPSTDKTDGQSVEQQHILPDGYLDNALPRLTKELVAEMTRGWRAVYTNHFEKPNSFYAIVRIDNLSEWRIIRDELKKATGVEAVYVRAYRGDSLLIELTYKGTSEQMAAHIADKTILWPQVPHDRGFLSISLRKEDARYELPLE